MKYDSNKQIRLAPAPSVAFHTMFLLDTFFLFE